MNKLFITGIALMFAAVLFSWVYAHAKECVSDCTTVDGSTHCQIHCFDGD